MPLSAIPEILEELKLGKPIVLIDDEDRENEGDVVFPAEKVTPEAINFMATQARGLICLALTAESCDKLHLHSQTQYNTAQLGTVVPVQVTVLQLLVRLIVTNPPAVPTGALPTVYEPRREQLDAAPVPGAP